MGKFILRTSEDLRGRKTRGFTDESSKIRSLQNIKHLWFFIYLFKQEINKYPNYVSNPYWERLKVRFWCLTLNYRAFVYGVALMTGRTHTASYKLAIKLDKKKSNNFLIKNGWKL